MCAASLKAHYTNYTSMIFSVMYILVTNRKKARCFSQALHSARFFHPPTRIKKCRGCRGCFIEQSTFDPLPLKYKQRTMQFFLAPNKIRCQQATSFRKPKKCSRNTWLLPQGCGVTTLPRKQQIWRNLECCRFNRILYRLTENM